VSLPVLIPTRQRSGALGLLLAVLVLGMSCTGPSPDGGGAAAPEGPARVYHVQVDMTKDQDAAHRALSKVLAWWGDQSSASLPEPLSLPDRSADSPATIVWKAPLYRVRLGPFASRTTAEEVLAAARSSFPDAFIAPEQRRAAAP